MFKAERAGGAAEVVDDEKEQRVRRLQPGV